MGEVSVTSRLSDFCGKCSCNPVYTSCAQAGLSDSCPNGGGTEVKVCIGSAPCQKTTCYRCSGCNYMYPTPPASTVCEGVRFTQTIKDAAESPDCPDQTVQATGTMPIEWGQWTQSVPTHTVCKGITYTSNVYRQSQNCGSHTVTESKTETLVGSKECGNCNYILTPTSNTVCQGVSFTQTLTNSGGPTPECPTQTIQAIGTLQPNWQIDSPATPAASTVCEGTRYWANAEFKDLNGCLPRQRRGFEAVGTKPCNQTLGCWKVTSHSTTRTGSPTCTTTANIGYDGFCYYNTPEMVVRQSATVALSVNCPAGDYCDGKAREGGLEVCLFVEATENGNTATVKYRYEDCQLLDPDLDIVFTLTRCDSQQCGL